MINRLFTNKKVTSTLATVSIIALLLSGTFAWLDYDQHKTNEAYGEGKKYEVTLNEDFIGKTEQDVKVNQEVNKDITVTNTGLTNGQFGDLYIRVQLKEFMETYAGKYTYTPDRYMVAAPEPFNYTSPDGDTDKDGNGTENFPQYMKRVYGVESNFNSLVPNNVDDDKDPLTPAANDDADTDNEDPFVLDTESTRVDGKMVSYGNYVTFGSMDDANKFAEALRTAFPDYYTVDLPEGSTPPAAEVVELGAMQDFDIDNDNEQVKRWYIKTQAKDPNGQYGKHLPTNYEVDKTNPKVVIPGTVNQSTQAVAEHKNGTQNCWQWQQDNSKTCPQENPHGGEYNKECEYPVHRWMEPLGATNVSPLETSQYFTWQLGPDVIMLKDWDGNATKKWILDPSAGVDAEHPGGWAYWGEALKPGQTTSKLLDSFTLFKEMDDPFYYAIHTDMEAVSQVDLESWKDAPAGFIDQFGPKKVVTDKTALNTAIANAGNADLGQYSPATAAAVTAALEAAKKVKDNPDSSQATIDAAAADLQDALAKLTGDKTGLGQAIDGAKAIIPDNYSPENIAKINEAVAKAEEVFKKVPVTQAEIDAAKTALEGVISGTPVVANKTALKAQIALTPGLVAAEYTPSTWAAMQAKLTPAKTADDDANATQQAVDLATLNLETAIKALVNIKALNAEKTTSETFYATPAVYTADSFAPFKTAYDKAVAVLAKTNATQAEVDAAKTALTDARNALQLKVVTGVTVAPATTNVVKGSKQPFTATVAGNGISQNVTWTVNSTISSISSTGELTVGAGETATSLVVTATSKDDPTKSGTATVSITDKTALNTAITDAGKLVSTEYSADTWAAVQAALNAANTAKTNANATQAEIDKAALDLNNAMKALSGDKSQLGGSIATAKAINPADFSPTSAAKIEAAIAAAEAVFNKMPATKTEIDAAKAALDKVLSETPKKADKTELQAQIARTTGLVQAEYSPSTWAVMQAKLTSANNANTNVDATQAAVDTAASELKTAVDALVKTKPLADEIATSALDIAKEAQYTKASFATFKAANTAAVAMLGNGAATQAEVDAAKTALENARLGLLTITVTGVTVDTTPAGVADVTKGLKQQFAAVVDGSNVTQDVTWSVNSTISTINPTTGELSVGAGETATSLIVTATSKDDPTKSGTATITVKAPIIPPGTTVGSTFNVDGVDWIVIRKDAAGNLQIVTKQIIAATNRKNNNLQTAIDNFYNSAKMEQLRTVALAVKLPVETVVDLSDKTKGLSTVLTTGTPQAFALSVAEASVMTAAQKKATNATGVTGASLPNGYYWLRTGTTTGASGQGSVVDTGGNVSGADNFDYVTGARPSLWVKP